MTFGFIRALFILICMVVGFQLGSVFQGYGSLLGLAGIGIGAAIAIAIIFIEQAIGKVSLRGLSAAVFGLILALIVSKFLSGTIDLIPQLDPATASSARSSTRLTM